MSHVLAKIPAFRMLSGEELDVLAQLASPVTFLGGESIPFLLKDGGFSFYAITKGHAKVGYQKQSLHPIRICGPGDFLGYGEWNSRYPHTAHALDSMDGLCFQREEFQNLLHTLPNLQEAMIKVLCDILSVKNDRISALENHSVLNRVASVLLSFSDKFGKETPEGLLIDLKIDRETIAKLAGTVTESLSRQLSDLESEKIICREGRSILIKRRDMLAQKARV